MNRRSFLRGIAAAAALTLVPLRWLHQRTTKVLYGAKVKLYVNGKLIGYASGVEYSTKVEPIDVLGRYEPVEYVPSEVSMNFTCERVVTGPGLEEFMKLTDEDRDALVGNKS